MKLTREALLEYLQKNMGVDVSRLDDDMPLFSSGLIDSFCLVEMVVFLEEKMGRRFQPEELSLPNVDTIGKILAFCNNSG